MDSLNLAKSWISMHKSIEGSDEYCEHSWAYNKLCDLCDDDPELCFDIIGVIRSLDGSDLILSNLAAGPLEDLLSMHGSDFIERIECLAKSDSQLKRMLGAVWKNSIPDPVWDRVKAIADKSW